MGGDFGSKRLTMTILSGLHFMYEGLVAAIDALEDGKNMYSLELVKICLLQGRQHKKKAKSEQFRDNTDNVFTFLSIQPCTNNMLSP